MQRIQYIFGRTLWGDGLLVVLWRIVPFKDLEITSAPSSIKALIDGIGKDSGLSQWFIDANQRLFQWANHGKELSPSDTAEKVVRAWQVEQDDMIPEGAQIKGCTMVDGMTHDDLGRCGNSWPTGSNSWPTGRKESKGTPRPDKR